MNWTHQEYYNLNMNKTILGDCSHFTSTGQFFVLLIITSLSLANNSVDGVEFVHILRYRTHECNRNIRISSPEIGILYQSVIWYRNDVMLSNCIWLFKKDYSLDSLSYLLKNNPWTYATTGRKFGHSYERLR